MKPTLSAVLIAKNEEKNLPDWAACLSWCDELVIISDQSTDSTEALAKKLGAHVFTHALTNDFAAQRNFALQKATSEWVLFVDGDERVTPQLAQEIQEKIAQKNAPDGFYIRRSDFLFGKMLKFGDAGTTSLLRLAKKNAGHWKLPVHEVWDVQGRTETLTHPLYHYPHPTIDEFLSEINTYSTIRAQELYEKKIQSNYFSILAYPAGKFLENYFYHLGVLDGEAGLVSALIMSFYSFLVRGKLWLLWHKK